MLRFWPLTSTAILLAGCAAAVKGRSDTPEYLANSTSYYAGEIRKALDRAGEFRDDYDTDSSKTSRNNFAFKMLEAHELALQDYARSLSVEGRGGLFATNVVALGLAAASAVTPSSALGAATTGVLGLQEGYSRDLLADNAVDVVLVQMTARHLEARRAIVGNLSRSVEEYPLAAVELDVRGLSRVTSFEAALADISGTASNNLQEAQDQDSSVTIQFSEAAARELENVLCIDKDCAQFKEGARDAANACLSEESSLENLLLVDLLDTARFVERRTLLACLKRKGFE